MQENHLIIQAILQKTTNLAAIVFVDFKQAYDSLFHSSLCQKIDSFAPEWTDTITKLLGGSSLIWFRGSHVGECTINRGVRQGDVISPMLFNIALSDLLRYFDTYLEGASLYDLRITNAGFADDLCVFLASLLDGEQLVRLLDEWFISHGMSVNDNKTQFFSLKPIDVIDRRWTQVKSFKYLGVPLSIDGTIHWEKVLLGLQAKLEAFKKVSRTRATLRDRVMLFNAYVTSSILHILKVDGHVPDKLYEKWKYNTRAALSNKATRVRWDRLIGSVKEGGFGLFDIRDLSRQSHLSWLAYLWRSNIGEKGTFELIVDRWTRDTPENASHWKSLSERFHTIQELGVPSEERSYIALLRSKPMLISEGVTVHRNGTKKLGRIVRSVPEVPSQRRWKVDGFDWKVNWSQIFKSRLPMKIKCWSLDALHTNLATAYTNDECNLCGDTIRSAHFLYECPYLYFLQPTLGIKESDHIVLRILVCWCLWRIHVDHLHGQGNEFPLITQTRKLIERVRGE